MLKDARNEIFMNAKESTKNRDLSFDAQLDK